MRMRLFIVTSHMAHWAQQPPRWLWEIVGYPSLMTRRVEAPDPWTDWTAHAMIAAELE